MRDSPTPTAETRSEAERQLAEENAELRIRLQELQDTLDSIHSGDVDALIVNDDIYTLESAHAATNRLRQDVLDQMEDAVFAFDNDGNIIYLNSAAERRYRVSSANVLGCHRSEVYAESEQSDVSPSGFGAFGRAEPVSRIEATHRLRDGTEIFVESSMSLLSDAAERTVGSLAVVRDVTERRRADIRREALVKLSDKFRDANASTDIGYEAAAILGEVLHVSRVGYGTIDHRAETLHVTRDWTAPGIESLAGTLRLRDYGSFIDSLKRNQLIAIADVRIDSRTAAAAKALEQRSARSFVNVPVVEHGILVAVIYVNHETVREWTVGDLVFIQDVAERARAVTERTRNAVALLESERRLREANENLEATVQARTRELLEAEQALRQAQKMEAVGQLTGGIAHDFNNLLGAMSASLQVLQMRLRQGRLEGLERYLTMAQDSVRRAAALTQRLLAFARRQTLDPKPTDANQLMSGMEDLIRRTVGPSVELEVRRAEGLWLTRIDASQLENSLLNLCINARDAMLPAGGRLTIATANHVLDERSAVERELPPGEYVSLSVKDTGIGMPPDVIKRAFDPFFTTKPLGQGTGLGLSMVYGFVRQSGGQVRIESEPGRGTEMRLYLPRHDGDAAQDPDSVPSGAVEYGHGETVLVIEDESTLRELIAESLRDAGYRIVSADDGAGGLDILESGESIDLLITDVGLPGGMNGRQVADAARVTRPSLKVLFITGYAEGVAVGNGRMEDGMEVLTKPFDITSLASKVRRMMGR